MFEKVANDIKNLNLTAATVDLLVFPDKTYCIIPRARSLNKEWIGAKVLNYRVDGNISKETSNEFFEKLLNGIETCYKYKDKGIDTTNKNMCHEFSTDGKKSNYKDYYYLTVSVLTNPSVIRINSLTIIDKKNGEWIGKPENSSQYSYDDLKEVYEKIKKYVNTPNR